MTVFHAALALESHGGTPSFLDVTGQVRGAIAASGIGNGIVAVMSPHTTCSVYYDEWAHDTVEDGSDFLQHDLNRVLGLICPDQTRFPPSDGYSYPGTRHFEEVESWPSAEEYLPGCSTPTRTSRRRSSAPRRPSRSSTANSGSASPATSSSSTGTATGPAHGPAGSRSSASERTNPCHEMQIIAFI